LLTQVFIQQPLGDAGGQRRLLDQESCAESSISITQRKEEENTYIYLFTLFTTGMKKLPSRAVYLLLFTINKQKNNHKKRRINKTRRRV
jgi:hypothetical protein